MDKAADVNVKGKDPIMDGPTMNVRAEFSQKHPVQEILMKEQREKIRTKRQMLAATYGAYLPLKLMMEQEILSGFHRLPGLESEYTGLETLNKRDLDIDFCDFYGNPSDVLEMPTRDLHTEMERKLKM
eukprot:Plantae.Rhodophyta-Purpureofilum_apyrenoidigerum.ctg14456.p2 GENE.Plantae.Rhodophyta-Purpureofilum_apyrenoidigerum.ctg14456~~Plantae.Rhodophyta-Purpureofilum_apyrenoidigerum.ctg14456.p2  ORF type:complete len:128 (+),score=35.98 Plantae.Rhodophyta-Purpureofilum_apyrenoidigerum.ctg14456:124-507(+)